MSPRLRQLIFWLPRVLGAFYAAFIGVFALDVWDMAGSFWYKLGGFLIHLVPTYILVAVLVVAWLKPKVGGIFYLVLAVLFSVYFHWQALTFVMLGLPMVAIGILFLLDWRAGEAKLRPGY